MKWCSIYRGNGCLKEYGQKLDLWRESIVQRLWSFCQMRQVVKSIIHITIFGKNLMSCHLKRREPLFGKREPSFDKRV